MAKQNAINNRTPELTVDPGAAGDSFIQFDINTTSEFRVGVDDDASDTFKLSQGSALGTNDTFVMTPTGERTMPLQPSFLGIQASTATNVTGNSTAYTLGSTVALTEVFDQGGDFTTAGVFTAPITGRYYIGYMVTYRASLSAGSATDFYGDIVTSNKTYRPFTLPTENTVTNFEGEDGHLPLSSSVVCDMDASDTVHIEVVGVGGSGDNDDLKGDATTAFTYFCGYLAC